MSVCFALQDNASSSDSESPRRAYVPLHSSTPTPALSAKKVKASLGWFTDTYGRQTGMRSLESAMDQICRDWGSSVFVYAVSAARQAVMTVFVHGEDIHNHGFPTREQCALMTGFDGDEGGPWSTTNSQTIVPGASGSSSTVKKHRHVSQLHAVQSHFLGGLTQSVAFFDPGDRLCCHASAPTCIACAH